MEFQTISKFPTFSSEYHYFVFNNDKIWAFSRNYVAQPTYNWGHRVSFTGGYTTYFDTKTSEWDTNGKVDFKEQASEENLEEFLFTFKNQIFMLLYSHFGGIQFLSLLKFDEESRNFARFAHVESDQKSQRVSQSGADTKHTAILVDGETDEGKYLVTYVDQIIQIHRLKISVDKQQVHVEYVGEISRDSVNGPPMLPTFAVVIDGSIYVQGAVQGCGLMWLPNRIFRVEINGGGFTLVEASGDHPPFGFTGSRFTALNPNTKNWTHFTGNTRHGMTGTTFNGEIWTLTNLNTGNPKWIKADLVAPDPETDDPLIVVDHEVANLYIGSAKIGVAKAKLNF